MDCGCVFCFAHDANDNPLGPACGKPAAGAILWKDGRYSPCCEEHGLEALDPDVLAEVSHFVMNTEGRELP